MGLSAILWGAGIMAVSVAIVEAIRRSNNG